MQATPWRWECRIWPPQPMMFIDAANWPLVTPPNHLRAAHVLTAFVAAATGIKLPDNVVEWTICHRCCLAVVLLFSSYQPKVNVTMMARTTEVLRTGSPCPCSPSCANDCSIRSFLPDQLLLRLRHIQCGIVIIDLPLRNTSGAKKQKGGWASRTGGGWWWFHWGWWRSDKEIKSEKQEENYQR